MATGPQNTQFNDALYDVSTLWELVRRRAEATPDAPMLFDEAERTLTFAEFAAKSERVAAGLMQLGVGPGSPVTWQLPTRMETVILSMALARLGAVQNPIIHIYREREVGFAVRQTGAELIVVPGTWRGYDYLAMAERIAAGMEPAPRILVAYDELPEADPAGLPEPPTSADDVRWIYYTSGTTSDPKGVRHSDGTLLAGGIGLAVALEMSPSDVGSIAFPFAHIGGPDYLVTMLTQGFPAILIEAFDPDDRGRRAEPGRGHHGRRQHRVLLDLPVAAPARRWPRATPARWSRPCGSCPGAARRSRRRSSTRSSARWASSSPMATGMTEVPMITQDSPEDTDEQLAYTEGEPVRGTEIAHRRRGRQ